MPMPDNKELNQMLTEGSLTDLMKLSEMGIYLELARQYNEERFRSCMETPPSRTVRKRLDQHRERRRLIGLGKAIFNRLQRKAYELICGSARISVKERNKIIESLGMKNEQGLIVILTTILVPHLGIAAPTAAVVAVLISRRIVEATHDTL
jgi:hypothetical protein